MLHVTVGIFGNAEYAKKLGKAGNVNDIAMYSHGSSEGVFTYVAVASDKIQTLLQVVNMIDIPVFVLNEINATVGEQIVAVSEFGFDNGFLMLENITKDQIEPFIKGTCIEKFVTVKDSVELTEEIKKLKIERKKEPLSVPIDNYFNVKSVGTVVLGIVKSGVAKKYDKVLVHPLEKEVIIKGIQSQDRDMEAAEAGTRVGLNLKGIEADELKRGFVVGKTEKTRKLTLRFTKSRYSKEQPKENDQVFLSSGLQVNTAKVMSLSGEAIEVESESFILYDKDTKFLVATTKQVVPRIIGRASLN